MLQSSSAESPDPVEARDSTIYDADTEPARLVNIVVAGTLLEVTRLVTLLLRATHPELGAKTDRVTELVRFACRALGLEQSWEFEVAARLSQIGHLGLDPELVAASRRGEVFEQEDQRALASHPLIARDLLCEVGRLEAVREMIARQSEPFTVGGAEVDPVEVRDRIELGGHLLRACSAFDDLVWGGAEVETAARFLAGSPSEFDPEVVEALASWARRPAAHAA
jgi:response regulator RpfG family c-di-GMP phosphodiesterase